MRVLFRYLSVSGLLGVLAFMSQVGPDDAVSNISKWVAKLTPPPDWVKAPELDTIWTWAFLFFAVLVLASYFWPTRKPVLQDAPAVDLDEGEPLETEEAALKAAGNAATPFDVTEWSNHRNYFVWVAACLWVEIRPNPNIPATSPAYRPLQLIKGDLVAGVAKSLDGLTAAGARISIQELRKIARRAKEQPKFLLARGRAKREKPEPNMRLADVVKRITGKDPLPLPMNTESMDVLHACDAIREKALLGLITAFGGINWRTTPPVDYDRMVRDVIPADFWKDHKIDVIGFLSPDDNYRGFTCDLTGHRGRNDYYGIWFDKHQIDTQFPEN